VTRLGVIFSAGRPSEELAGIAAAPEAAGLDELWLWEDCFLAGGIAASATALAATEPITDGLGVMPAVFRNAVACAMEIATLARLHPGRLVAGPGARRAGLDGADRRLAGVSLVSRPGWSRKVTTAILAVDPDPCGLGARCLFDLPVDG
jgi:alkanesulfonate monooxygenase SsuD/methylene tetrahydromethanopterin reductase-like flavin-dependent oxidoreductase (luciferase family)